MAAGLFLARPFPLRMGEAQEVTKVAPWEDLFVAHEPQPETGPVAVEIGYRIRAEETAAFLDAVSQLRAPRRRATVADHELERQVRAFVVAGESVTMQHYIAER